MQTTSQPVSERLKKAGLLILALAMLLLSAPAWAGDAYTPVWRDIGTAPVIDYDATFPKRYEYDIIPESELKDRLNAGWECVKIYTIMKDMHKVGTVRGEYPPEGMPVNKAIIRRVKP